jgi:hypothetical protein
MPNLENIFIFHLLKKGERKGVKGKGASWVGGSRIKGNFLCDV